MTKLLAALLLGSTLVAATAVAQPPATTDAPAAHDAGLTVDSGIKALLADAHAKAILNKYAPQVVEFLSSPDSAAMVPPETPLSIIAQNDMAQQAGLTPENMKKIAEELAAH